MLSCPTITTCVLRVDADKANSWTLDEVIERWHTIYKGNFISQRYLCEGKLPRAESLTLEKDAEKWRERLCNISWLMKALNEPIARMANQEDNYTGRFYEGRFKSQALLDEQAILACMAYVDLNPIRAKLANMPETSEFTSIKDRIEAAKEGKIPIPLHAFKAANKSTNRTACPSCSKTISNSLT